MSTLDFELEKDELPHHETKRDYLLIYDLPQRVEALRLANLEVPTHEHHYFTELNTKIVRILQDHVPPGTKVRTINMCELAVQILTKAQEVVTSLEHALVVSTCPEIAYPSHGVSLEVNRLIDIHGNVIGIGPRPSHPDIDSQIRSIVARADGKPIVLIEDGTFTGGTISFLIREIQKKHGKVGAVVLGFSFPESQKPLEAVINPNCIYRVLSINNPLDWVPDHDFFPFIPNCGRVVGTKINGLTYPFYSHDGITYSIPYLSSYCPMAKWTGLTANGKDLCRVTSFFLQKNLELFSILEDLNRKELTYNDLRHARPQSSIPCSVDQAVFPKISDMRIVDYLQDVIQEIW